MTPQLMYTSELLTFTGNIMIFTLVLVDKYALKILPTYMTHQVMYISKLQTESDLLEKLWTGLAKTFGRSAKIDFIYNSLLHMI